MFSVNRAPGSATVVHVVTVSGVQLPAPSPLIHSVITSAPTFSTFSVSVSMMRFLAASCGRSSVFAVSAEFYLQLSLSEIADKNLKSLLSVKFLTHECTIDHELTSHAGN